MVETEETAYAEQDRETQVMDDQLRLQDARDAAKAKPKRVPGSKNVRHDDEDFADIDVKLEKPEKIKLSPSVASQIRRSTGKTAADDEDELLSVDLLKKKRKVYGNYF